MKGFFAFCIIAALILPLVEGTSKEDAQLSLNQSRHLIDTLRENNYPVAAFEDIYKIALRSFERAEFSELIRQNSSSELAKKAESALEGLDYEGFKYSDVVEHTNRISQRYNDLFNIQDQLRALEIKINHNGDIANIDIVPAERNLRLAKESFFKERFTDSKQQILAAHESIDDQRAWMAQQGLIARTQNNILKEYGTITALVSSIVLIIALISTLVLRRMHLQKKLRNYLREKKALQEMFEKTQIERYKLGTLSRHQYTTRMNKYHSKLSTLKNNISVLEAKLGRKRKNKAVLIIGRFQPLHNGHLKLLAEKSVECEELIIAVLVNRGTPESNPLSFDERKNMINEVMASQDILNYSIYPFPELSSYLDYAEYVRRMLPHFDFVTSTDIEILNAFKLAGFKVEQHKTYTSFDSDEILERMNNNDLDQDNVPNSVISFLKRRKIKSHLDN